MAVGYSSELVWENGQVLEANLREEGAQDW